jgi:hypothetical protein
MLATSKSFQQPRCIPWQVRITQLWKIGGQAPLAQTQLICLSFAYVSVDAWAKSGEGVSAAQRAEAILQHMHQLYQTTGQENLRPTTGIFNAVINAWARSRDKIAPSRAEQILQWMDNLHQTNPSIQPDKYTFNTGAFGPRFVSIFFNNYCTDRRTFVSP